VTVRLEHVDALDVDLRELGLLSLRWRRDLAGLA
jgi:hypothetical protein